MKEKLWLISEVFYPDTDIATGNIATEIALKFSEKYEVHVICGPKDYERSMGADSISDDLGKDIYFHRFKYFNLNKNKSVKRLVRVVGISLGLFLKGFKIKKRDKVFVISNPAFITPLYSVLKYFKRFHYILLMHDVFPENLIAGGYTKENSFIYKITKKIFVKSRKSIDNIIVIGRDMKELLLSTLPSEKKKSITIIPNWADVETITPQNFRDNEVIKKLKLQEKVIIMFAGNHGILQNIQEFIKLIVKVENPIVHFIFAGGGATKKELIKYAEDNRLQNITFLPAFPRNELNAMLNACHIGLVSLSDKLYGVGVPSKSYNILAAEKPILFIGNKNTEIPMFITEENIGWSFSYSDKEGIINFLNKIKLDSLEDFYDKGKRGRLAVVEKYSKEKVLENMLHIV